MTIICQPDDRTAPEQQVKGASGYGSEDGANLAQRRILAARCAGLDTGIHPIGGTAISELRHLSHSLWMAKVYHPASVQILSMHSYVTIAIKWHGMRF